MKRAIKKEAVLFFLSITSLEKPFPSPCGSFKNYEPLVILNGLSTVS